MCALFVFHRTPLEKHLLYLPRVIGTTHEKRGGEDGWKGEGGGWSLRESSWKGVRNRKHMSEPDKPIGRVDPNGRVGEAGPCGLVEQAGC
eukprot:9160527-Pyramimonas_sp.AAC.1